MMPRAPKPPAPPPPPKMPESPLDQAKFSRPDDVSTAYSSLISTSPVGVKKAAVGAKKTLLGGAK